MLICRLGPSGSASKDLLASQRPSRYMDCGETTWWLPTLGVRQSAASKCMMRCTWQLIHILKCLQKPMSRGKTLTIIRVGGARRQPGTAAYCKNQNGKDGLPIHTLCQNVPAGDCPCSSAKKTKSSQTLPDAALKFSCSSICVPLWYHGCRFLCNLCRLQVSFFEKPSLNTRTYFQSIGTF